MCNSEPLGGGSVENSSLIMSQQCSLLPRGSVAEWHLLCSSVSCSHGACQTCCFWFPLLLSFLFIISWKFKDHKTLTSTIHLKYLRNLKSESKILTFYWKTVLKLNLSKERYFVMDKVEPPAESLFIIPRSSFRRLRNTYILCSSTSLQCYLLVPSGLLQG